MRSIYLLFFTLLSNVFCRDDPRIIIIGAGAAGISTAVRLYKNGIKNITILEAQDRIGGRIHSLKFGESHLDLGAQWCHGERNNVVYELVKDLNLLVNDDRPSALYHSRLKLIRKEFVDQLEQIMDMEAPTNESGSYVTVGEFLVDRYTKGSLEVWKSEEDMKLADECLEMFHNTVLAEHAAFSWFNMSLISEYEVCEGNQQLSWNPWGYKAIFEVLLQIRPDPSQQLPVTENLVLNKEVTTVSRNSVGCVVTCTDGSNYTADHVILTSSLGVLKHRNLLFAPELPNDKLLAIESLGFGAICKIFLYFSNRWWNDDFDGATFVWDKEDLKESAKLFPEGPKKGGKSWISAISEITPVAGSSNVLAVWCAGEFVPEIEGASNDTIINGAVFMLKRFLSGYNITAPDEILWHKWYSDPHFRGTYSYTTVEARKFNESQRVVLSKPILSHEGKPLVLFAGEATNPIHYATVHGAIESGFREADRLVDFYKSM